MLSNRPSKVLPFIPSKSKIKIALGVVSLIFLLDIQPSFKYPPFHQPIVYAQTIEQSTAIKAQSVPFTFQLPHPGYLSTRFSVFHPGIDIATGLGMPIKPITSGTVINTGYNFWGLGLIVEVNHTQGYSSLYAHMGKIYVKVGQTVTTNDILGEVGLTGNTSGPHTHLEIHKDGKSIDPLPLLPTIRNYPIEQDFKAVAKTSDTTNPNLTKQFIKDQLKSNL